MLLRIACCLCAIFVVLVGCSDSSSSSGGMTCGLPEPSAASAVQAQMDSKRGTMATTAHAVNDSAIYCAGHGPLWRVPRM